MIRGSSDPHALIVHRGKLYFSANNRLWSSDGTVSGTRPVAAFIGQPPTFFASGGRSVWFMTYDERVWSTNGTPAGTRMVGRFLDLLQATDQRPAAHGFLVAATPGSTGTEPLVFDPSVGEPCGRDRRAPTLYASDPILGARMQLRGDDALGIVTFGPPLVTRLAPDCRLHVAVPTPLLAFTPTAAAWDATVRLPLDPSLSGVTEAMQVVFGPTDGPLGVDFTNTVFVTYGAQPTWD